MTFGLVAISFVMTPSLCRAVDDEYSYTIDVDKYIFVMLSRTSQEDEIRLRGPVEADRIRELRKRYPRSGLYLRDGKPADPLWTVDWYSHGIHVASDGIHLVRTRQAPVLPAERDLPQRPDLSAEAISFFANGKLLKTYRIEELVSAPDKLRRMEGYFVWNDEESSFSGGFKSNLGIDNKRPEYRLATVDGNEFTFDLRTGTIVSEKRVPPPVQTEQRGWLRSIGPWIAVAVLSVVLALWGWVRYRRTRYRAEQIAAPSADRVV